VTEETAADFQEFLAILRKVPSSMFRGQERPFPLRPSVGRELRPRPRDTTSPEVALLRREKSAIEEFRREARAYVTSEQTEIEWLALAQHHGVPTRLLDWTWNPLSALYFAVDPARDDAGEDAVLYAIGTGTVRWWEERGANWDHTNQLRESPPFNPGSLDHVRAYTPPKFSPRLLAQAAVLTMHALPWQALEDERMTRITIPKMAKNGFREILFSFHAMPKTLFPDLDGLGATIRQWWFRRDLW